LKRSKHHKFPYVAPTPTPKRNDFIDYGSRSPLDDKWEKK